MHLVHVHNYTNTHDPNITSTIATYSTFHKPHDVVKPPFKRFAGGTQSGIADALLSGVFVLMLVFL